MWSHVGKLVTVITYGHTMSKFSHVSKLKKICSHRPYGCAEGKKPVLDPRSKISQIKYSTGKYLIKLGRQFLQLILKKGIFALLQRQERCMKPHLWKVLYFGLAFKSLGNFQDFIDNNCTILMHAWHLSKRGSVFTAQRYTILCNGISFCDDANDYYYEV